MLHAEPLYPLPSVAGLAGRTLTALYDLQERIAFWCCRRPEGSLDGCDGCTWVPIAERSYDTVDAEIQTRPAHKAAVTRLARRMRETRR